MKKFGIPCPAVQVLNKHVLVMSFIGKDQIPAPKLKDAPLSVEDLEDAYEQVVKVRLHFEVRKCAWILFLLCALGTSCQIIWNVIRHIGQYQRSPVKLTIYTYVQ